MPRHRSLTLKSFVDSVDFNLMKRYIEQKVPAKFLPKTIIHDGDYVDRVLDDLKKQGQDKIVIEVLDDFTRINDLGQKTMNVLIQATDLYDISRSGRETKSGLAMRLFLDHPEAFQYAYDRYCFLTSSSTVREYIVDSGKVRLSKSKLADFKKIASSFYGQQEKGYDVVLRHYEDGPEIIIVVDRGSYFQTKPVWEDGKISTITYRPANEDILIFNKDSSILSIKAPYDKDRINYRAAFYKTILGSTEPEPEPDALYNLKPIQDGSFDYGENEDIRQVKLLSVNLHFPDKASVVLTSKDLLKSLGNEFSGYSLKTGKMTHAKFRFRVITGDKTKDITVEITPPNITDLYKKPYANLIADYLIKQKVKVK
jgi:hypothetical protein